VSAHTSQPAPPRSVSNQSLAYYNEHDRFAAAWLRELIAAGHIAPGMVDERSIVEVQPDELKDYCQCHFFAGIGVWSYALRAAGWPDDSPVWTGSCPCQGFSASGKRGGFSDQRHLWPAWFRLIGECAPHTIFGEQVASKDGLAWLDVVSADMEGAGYAIGTADLCAAGVGAPHIRQRLYFVAESACNGRERQSAQHRSGGAGDSAASGGQQPGDCGAGTESVAGSERSGWNGRAPEPRWGTESGDAVAGRSKAGSVADAQHPERGREQQASRARSGRSGSGRNGAAGELGNAARGGCGVRGSASGDAGRPALAGGIGDVEHATIHGRQQGTDGIRGREPFPSSPGVEGFWSNAEWIPCRDGKARPVEPGTFPLAHGIAGRVGRLRGYGNALCAPAAQAFIEAYLELR